MLSVTKPYPIWLLLTHAQLTSYSSSQQVAYFSEHNIRVSQLARKGGGAPELSWGEERVLHSPIVGSTCWQLPQSSRWQISARKSRGKITVGQSNCLGELIPFPTSLRGQLGCPRGLQKILSSLFRVLFSGQSAVPLSIIDQRWLPEVKQNRGHFVLALIFFLSISKAWLCPLFIPSHQSLLRAIESICSSQSVNLQSSWYVWEVSNGEGRNKGTQMPTDSASLSLWQERDGGQGSAASEAYQTPSWVTTLGPSFLPWV